MAAKWFGVVAGRRFIIVKWFVWIRGYHESDEVSQDSERKLFDIVLVWKLDRLARNRYDSAHYKTRLKKNGVKLMSATEIISDRPEGIILESVLEGYAEYYSADLSEKVCVG